MKETEEDVYMKALRSCGKEATSFNIAKAYHKLMLKSSFPSKEEIEKKAFEFDNTAISPSDFVRGAKWVLNLLTK